MKKIYILISAALLAAGCTFLDFDETSSLNSRENMYQNYSYIQRMLTNIYGYMPGKDIVAVSDAMRDCGCDDAEFGDPSASVQRYGNGNWSAFSTVDTQWSLYNAIRSTWEFLESIQTIDISKYRYDAKYSQWLEHLKYYPYEARLLKAYYLFELARRYGDIPVPMKMLSIEEANSIEKTPFNDVIKYIVEECDECAANLPTTYIGMLDDEYGRVTKGFAMAVKAKALLYAASPLHNGAADAAKWQEAAKAALDIIDSGLYRLDPSLYQGSELFLQALRKEKELRLYHEKVRADGNVVNLNRQRMNFSAEEYDRLFDRRGLRHHSRHERMGDGRPCLRRDQSLRGPRSPLRPRHPGQRYDLQGQYDRDLRGRCRLFRNTCRPWQPHRLLPTQARPGAHELHP